MDWVVLVGAGRIRDDARRHARIAVHYPGAAQPMPAMPPLATRHLRPLPRVCGMVVAVLLLAACGSAPQRSHAPATRSWPLVMPSEPAAANAVTIRALGLVGTPYRWGGNSPESGFDCSGLVHYVYQNVLDLRLPRTSRELAEVQGPRIPERQLASGDLVFFGSGREVSHVGIYVGEGRFVHAPTSGGTVRLDRLDGAYWRDHYSGARRVLDGRRASPKP